MAKSKKQTSMVDNNTGEIIQRHYPIIKKQFNPHPVRPHDYETPTGPSLTIPDQSMSILEIQARFASGLGLSTAKDPQFDGGEDPLFDGVNPLTLDLSERMDLIHHYVESGINAQKDIKHAKEQKHRAKLKSEAEAAAKALYDAQKASEQAKQG